jgi:hypothetical protein
VFPAEILDLFYQEGPLGQGWTGIDLFGYKGDNSLFEMGSFMVPGEADRKADGGSKIPYFRSIFFRWNKA